MMTCVRLINKLQNEEYYDEFYNLDKRSFEALQTVIDKHNKAKRLLFKIMNDRIEEWWD
jgi:cytidylate kinase